MRTINKIFSLLAIASLAAFVGCQPEEKFQPGEPENEACQGVYFPKQKKIEEVQIFDPTQAKLDTIKVSRTNEDSTLTIAPKISLSYLDAKGNTVEADSATLAAFKVGDIKFDDGQVETIIPIDFNGIEEGVQYSLHIAIEGDEYASIYSSSLKACDYKVMCVKYEDFVSPADSTKPAKITFTSSWWGETHTAYMKYYEVGGVRHCTTYDEELVGVPDVDGGADGFWGTDKNTHLTFLWYVEDQLECDAGDGPHTCQIPAGHDAPEGSYLISLDGPQFIFTHSVGDIFMWDNYAWSVYGGYARPFLHYTHANNLLDETSYYDGNGGFFFYSYWHMTTAGSGWNISDFDVIGIAEGFTRADYKIKLTAGITELDEAGTTNIVPIDFTLGADVAKVGYTVTKGALSGAQINDEGLAIAKDTIKYEYAKYVDANGVSFSDSISVAETGVYTLVAVGFDAKKKAQTTASVTFNYLATGETNDVIIDVEAATTEKYAAYDSDLSFEFSITGSGITGAIPMFISQVDMEAMGGLATFVIDSVLAKPNYYYSLLSLEENNPGLTAKQLADVNDKGYVDIYTKGVTPGTVYYVVVWATNGYDYGIDFATVTTTGDPLPIYMNYDYSSANMDLAPEHKDGYFGTWNYYAVDWDGSSLRAYLGKAEIADSAIPTEGPDESGLYDEYCQISGLTAGYVEKDTILLDYYAGKLYIATNAFVDDSVTDTFYWMTNGGTGYNGNYLLYGIPVADGYLAFVCSQANASYGFSGLWFYDADKVFSDMLLVRPDKDDNGVAPAGVVAKMAAAKKALNMSNCVETIEGAKLSREERLEKVLSTNTFFGKGEGVKGLQASHERVAAGHKLGTSAKRGAGKLAPVSVNR